MAHPEPNSYSEFCASVTDFLTLIVQRRRSCKLDYPSHKWNGSELQSRPQAFSASLQHSARPLLAAPNPRTKSARPSPNLFPADDFSKTARCPSHGIGEYRHQFRCDAPYLAGCRATTLRESISGSCGGLLPNMLRGLSSYTP